MDRPYPADPALVLTLTCGLANRRVGRMLGAAMREPKVRSRLWPVCKLAAALWPFLAGSHLPAQAAETGSSSGDKAGFPVQIRVDAASNRGDLKPVWRFFGYDEPNYTYLPDGKKLLSQLAGLGSATVFVRAHNLLTSGDGTPALKWGSTGAYTEDTQGKPRYDWQIVDRIFNTYLERGLKPYVEIGFMPEALSSRPVPYQHRWAPGTNYGTIFTGWSYPPKDYVKWGELVYQWALHCAHKFGRAEAERWYWEVWNEPDIPYWQGTLAEYCQLYDYAVAAVRRALPHARVGGPESTGPRGPRSAEFLRGFLEHCLRGTNAATGQMGAPLDFISFHAKGAPRLAEGHVQMGSAAQLRDLDQGFRIVAGFPELRRLPIVVGESDPDGCAACPASVYPQNAYRSGPLYASYTAATLARAYDLAEQHGVNFEGALTWAFEFEGQPYFAGFRAMATRGLELPVLNVFRMFGRLPARRLSLTSTGDPGLETMVARGVRQAPDVAGLASRDRHHLGILVWHYHDDDVPGPAAAVELTVSGLPVGRQKFQLSHYRIDERHSNCYSAWKDMGAPEQPSPSQYAALEHASALTLLEAPRSVEAVNQELTIRFELPRQAVSLLLLQE